MKDTKRVPSYAFLTHFGFTREVRDEFLADSCKTCGFPHMKAGAICPDCLKEVRDEAMIRAFGEYMELVTTRGVHIHGVGLVDPWSHEGRRYLDD